MNSAATAAVASAAAALDPARCAYAGGGDTIKVGLVGCGGRGTGAADQALSADPGTTLIAMGDAFADQIEGSLSTLKAAGVADRVQVPAEHRFAGFDAYKHVIDLVDVVLLATPPGFRPIHFAYAVEKGKHAFIEKPVAVDGPGLRAFVEAARVSKEKKLCVVNGFCWRYSNPRRETMRRVLAGELGPIRSIETTYNSQGVWDPRRSREQCTSDMEYQMRNWYYYDWLSGDHIVEQAVHGIDTMGWAMNDTLPERCWGVGGRQARTEPKYGNIWDHFSIVYEYPGDVRGYHQCRHWPNTPNHVRDYIHCAGGTADVFGNRLNGETRWRYRGETNDMYQTEHNEMYAAIRAGKPINNAEQAGSSTLLAIMGRMAAYTGQVVTPEMVMDSQESLVPAHFEWAEAPSRPIPVPGITRFV